MANILSNFKSKEKVHCIMIMIARGLGEGLLCSVPP